MMKKKESFIIIIFCSTMLLCGILNFSFAQDISQSINASDEGAFHAHSKKKKPQTQPLEIESEALDAAQSVRAPSNPENSPENIVKEESLEKEEDRQRLRLSITPSYMTVEGNQLSNGSVGILNSKLYPALKLDYTFKSQDWMFNAIVGRREVTFENSVDRTVMSPSHTLYRFDLALARRLGRFSLGPGVGMEDKFFYKVVNQSFADSETRSDKKFYVYSDYQFYKGEKHNALLIVKAGMNPTESTEVYDIQRGFFYSATMKIDRAVTESKNVGLEFTYKAEDYKTQQLHLKASEVGIGVTFGFEWGVR